MDKFAKYNAYSANNERAMECLDKLLKENSGFTTLCDEVKRLEQSKQQDIAGYLVKPFQRICRYQLLLGVCQSYHTSRWCCMYHRGDRRLIVCTVSVQELHKHTPTSWEDHEHLATAVSSINKLVSGANETKRITDNLYKLTEIRNRFKAVCHTYNHNHNHNHNLLLYLSLTLLLLLFDCTTTRRAFDS
jgi:hypothetical protein